MYLLPHLVFRTLKKFYGFPFLLLFILVLPFVFSGILLRHFGRTHPAWVFLCFSPSVEFFTNNVFFCRWTSQIWRMEMMILLNIQRICSIKCIDLACQLACSFSFILKCICWVFINFTEGIVTINLIDVQTFTWHSRAG